MTHPSSGVTLGNMIFTNNQLFSNKRRVITSFHSDNHGFSKLGYRGKWATLATHSLLQLEAEMPGILVGALEVDDILGQIVIVSNPKGLADYLTEHLDLPLARAALDLASGALDLGIMLFQAEEANHTLVLADAAQHDTIHD